MYTVPLIINNEITNLSLAQTMFKNMTDMFAVIKIVFYLLIFASSNFDTCNQYNHILIKSTNQFFITY